MEKSQLNLSLRVLKKMDEAGVLSNIVIVGSWCLYFYKNFFKDDEYSPEIRTRDIDFLVPRPHKFKKTVDLSAIFKDMGFIVNFRGEGGYIRFDHPDLIIEFLVPEIGRGSDKPYPLPELCLNAQPLRYLNFLAEHTINIEFEKMNLKLPHPAAYALHKLIVFGRRKTKDKAEKDKIQAIQLLKHLSSDTKNIRIIKDVFNSMHKKWQKTVLNNLEKMDEKELKDLLV